MLRDDIDPLLLNISHTDDEQFTSMQFITEGIVMRTDDPDQMGRLKIWIPLVDGEYYNVETLPWAEYASPLAGSTNNFKAGRQNLTTHGPRAYGIWAIPKIGAQVLCFFLQGNPNRRFYFASYFGLHENRSLPDGRNHSGGCFSDTYEEVHPTMDNLKQQFKNNLSAPQAKTRGVFERQVAQDKTQKDGTDGYSVNTVDEEFVDPQTYCFVSPGGHAVIMQDNPEQCRVRIKTIEGNQLLLDDANERIYLSTARGGCWLEFDEDGHIHLFGKESISVRSGKDINFLADQDVNIEAKRNVNIAAITGTMSIASKSKMSIQSTSENVHLTACADMHILGSAITYIDGGTLHLNLPGATCGQTPQKPSIIPDHEPWNRPPSTIGRNPHWKE